MDSFRSYRKLLGMCASFCVMVAFSSCSSEPDNGYVVQPSITPTGGPRMQKIEEAVAEAHKGIGVAATAIGQAASTVADNADDANRKIRQGIEEGKRAVDELSNQAAEKMREGKQAAAEAADRISETYHETVEEIRRRRDEAAASKK